MQTSTVSTPITSGIVSQPAAPAAMSDKDQLALVKIESLVTGLQKQWGDYQAAPNGELQERLKQSTEELKKEIQTTRHLAESLTGPQKKLLEERANYAVACEAQLGEIQQHLGVARPNQEVAIPAAELQKRKADFVRGSSPTTLFDSFRRDTLCADLLKADGLEIVDVPGDGNCGIHAIVEIAYPEATDKAHKAQTLRADMVGEMRKTMLAEVQNQVKDGMVATLTDTNTSAEKQQQVVNDYCDHMARNGTWIGERELQIFSRLLKRPLFVYKPNNLKINDKGHLEPWDLHKHNASASGDPIRVLHSASHYRALRKK